MKSGLRLHLILVRWGLLKHPHDREHAKQRIGLLGNEKCSNNDRTNR